jgi:gamma-glutamyltranspeptidase/glutathione hydrolase/leukotriene-C4 hydrolase
LINSTISFTIQLIVNEGGLAVAVPGELAGSWAAHQKYGKLPWSRLVLPTAEMAEKGIPVNSHLANSLQEFEKLILDEPSMR